MNTTKRIGIKRVTVVISFSLFLMAFQNCGNVNFSTQDTETPSAVAGVIPPSADAPSNSVQFEIPDQPYEKLSESSFFKLADKTAVNTLTYVNFKLYSPQYPLYSDGASKRRWVYVPEGTAIDNSDPDSWVFPKGTILFKEFSVGGKKIETRVFEKITNQSGFSAWRASVYVWLANQLDADLLKVDNFYSQTDIEMLPYQANVVGSQYRMVTMTQCQTCHATVKDVSQGFSYLQLSDASKSINVFKLDKLGYFSNSINRLDSIPGTEMERAAIGYIQSNCATCHSGVGPGPHNFRHKSTSQTLAEEPLIKAIGASSGLVTFGAPLNSRLYNRMANKSMPRVTLFTQDSAGLKLLEDWITNSVMP
ncbi:MAG: hypothetical protein JNM24_12290 [Bdellovibrionaceae bacterium]|nr:hypothetical protein [Pseudobdellovibrionaceae bacterium]